MSKRTAPASSSEQPEAKFMRVKTEPGVKEEPQEEVGSMSEENAIRIVGNLRLNIKACTLDDKEKAWVVKFAKLALHEKDGYLVSRGPNLHVSVNFSHVHILNTRTCNICVLLNFDPLSYTHLYTHWYVQQRRTIRDIHILPHCSNMRQNTMS